MKKISGVYKIENIITGDFYIGSNINVKSRWINHKCPSRWKEHPNSPMYHDMQKYGVENFDFTILFEVKPEQLKEKEQELIETLKPTCNNYRAKGWDVERYKEPERKAYKKYMRQLCLYNGETLTLDALRSRFSYAGIEHPTVEAKKYLKEVKKNERFYI